MTITIYILGEPKLELEVEHWIARIVHLKLMNYHYLKIAKSQSHSLIHCMYMVIHQSRTTVQPNACMFPKRHESKMNEIFFSTILEIKKPNFIGVN